MKLIKGNRIINATEKAYEVIFKQLGYKIYNDEENDLKEQLISKEKEDTNRIGIDDMTKAEIIEILADRGIEHNPRDKKEILYNLMVQGD